MPGYNNRKKLVLLGGGGHCKSVLDSISRIGGFLRIAITDRTLQPGTDLLGSKVVGNDDMLPKLYEDGFRFAFITVGSIGDHDIRQRLFNKIKNTDFAFLTIDDPSSVVSETAQIGEGVFIGKNAVINSHAVIGEQAIINTGAIVEHDCSIGAFAHIAVGAVICGGACIGKNVFVGANATVLHGVRIGPNTIVAAGAVVTGDIPGNCVAVGVPARLVNGDPKK